MQDNNNSPFDSCLTLSEIERKNCNSIQRLSQFISQEMDSLLLSAKLSSKEYQARYLAIVESGFSSIPTEILFMIVGFLNVQEIAVMSCLCKYMNFILNDNSLWRFLCLRDFSPVQNTLINFFKKSWKWVYRSKSVIYSKSSLIPNEGVGSLVCSNGKFEGEWKDGKLHGYGIVYSATGNLLEGQWKKGMGNGMGKVLYSNGDFYVGQWKDGTVKGKGVCYFSHGVAYEGEWKNNKVHGKGTCWFADGRRYIGQWNEGEKHGKGLYIFTDGHQFKGKWKHNKPNGKGYQICINGKKSKSHWSQEFECCQTKNNKQKHVYL